MLVLHNFSVMTTEAAYRGQVAQAETFLLIQANHSLPFPLNWKGRERSILCLDRRWMVVKTLEEEVGKLM